MTRRSNGKSARSGGSGPRTAPPESSWRARLDDPDEPLYTLAVAADLLELDTQALRRLSVALDQGEARPSGNQRRFSRRDIERLSAASDLAAQGHNHQSIATILDLTAQVERLEGV